MKAIAFEAQTHFKEILSWAQARGESIPPLKIFPKMGRIVPGVAIIFCYKTDSVLGFLENLITNPAVPAFKASRAIDLCISAIEQDAAREGIEVLISTTFVRSVCRKARRLGFKIKDDHYKYIYKGIV